MGQTETAPLVDDDDEVAANTQPVTDEKTGRPRIKGTPRRTKIDRLRKGVKPAIIGEAILIECHTCGYGGVRDPWHGFFAIPKTDANQKRAENGGAIQCPHCYHPDCSRVKDSAEAIKSLSREEADNKVRLQNQEIAELKRQNAILLGSQQKRQKSSEGQQ